MTVAKTYRTVLAAGASLLLGEPPAGKASMAIGFKTGKATTSFESEPRLRLHLGSKPRNAATTETTGYARAFRRAFDWQQRRRLR
jgi:hypothetical protein